MCNNYNCTEFLSNLTEGVIDKHCNINHSLPFLFTVISLLYMVTLCVISLHMWCVHLGIITLMHCCLPLQKVSKQIFFQLKTSQIKQNLYNLFTIVQNTSQENCCPDEDKQYTRVSECMRAVRPDRYTPVEKFPQKLHYNGYIYAI